MEIRLGGAPLHDALPYQTPDDWQHCRFERLADYFRLRTLKENLDPLARTVAEASDQMGERKTRNRKGGGIREYSKATKADPINEAIRQALRNLSNRWKGTGKRGRPARTACGNSVRINKQNPHKHGAEQRNSNNYIYDEQQDKDNQKQQQKETTWRDSESSAESAKPIQPDATASALDDLIQQYEATPGAKNEHNRIEAIMRGCRHRRPHPHNIEVLEKSPTLEGIPFINGGDFS